MFLDSLQMPTKTTSEAVSKNSDRSQMCLLSIRPTSPLDSWLSKTQSRPDRPKKRCRENKLEAKPLTSLSPGPDKNEEQAGPAEVKEEGEEAASSAVKKDISPENAPTQITSPMKDHPGRNSETEMMTRTKDHLDEDQEKAHPTHPPEEKVRRGLQVGAKVLPVTGNGQWSTREVEALRKESLEDDLLRVQNLRVADDWIVLWMRLYLRVNEYIMKSVVVLRFVFRHLVQLPFQPFSDFGV